MLLPLNEDDDFLSHWVRIMNKGHGYAGVFNYDTAEDKRIVERGVLDEWRRAAETSLDVRVKNVVQNPNDPPDFYLTIAGKKLAVELVQLVEREHKQRAMKGETPYAGQLFSDMQWTEQRFLGKLTDIVQRKNEKYKRKDLQIDILIIHTSEPWLTAKNAGLWLKNARFEDRTHIRAACLMLDYEPSETADHWPVFMIYGTIK